jgi:hypothetical protein
MFSNREDDGLSATVRSIYIYTRTSKTIRRGKKNENHYEQQASATKIQIKKNGYKKKQLKNQFYLEKALFGVPLSTNTIR